MKEIYEDFIFISELKYLLEQNLYKTLSFEGSFVYVNETIEKIDDKIKVDENFIDLLESYIEDGLFGFYGSILILVNDSDSYTDTDTDTVFSTITEED